MPFYGITAIITFMPTPAKAISTPSALTAWRTSATRLWQSVRVEKEFNASQITSKEYKVFQMYHGDQMKVRVRFSNHLVDAVIDQFGKGAKVLHPEAAVDKMREFIGKLTEMYNDEEGK